MRSLPNFNIVVPADPNQAVKVIKEAAVIDGPFYIRLSRYNTGNFIDENLEYEFGKAQEIVKGEKVAIIGTGPILKNCVAAQQELADKGIKVGLYNFHTIKPIDEDKVKEIVNSYEHIVTVEEHNVIGGLGTAVSDVVAGLDNSYSHSQVTKIGVQDCFGESGGPEELLKKYNLDAKSIVRQIKDLL